MKREFRTGAKAALVVALTGAGFLAAVALLTWTEKDSGWEWRFVVQTTMAAFNLSWAVVQYVDLMERP